MKDSTSEKYLGDIIDKNCNSHATIADRILKGNAILSNIRAMLNDIPLGNKSGTFFLFNVANGL